MRHSFFFSSKSYFPLQQSFLPAFYSPHTTTASQPHTPFFSLLLAGDASGKETGRRLVKTGNYRYTVQKAKLTECWGSAWEVRESERELKRKQTVLLTQVFIYIIYGFRGLPWWLSWWRIHLQCRRLRFNPWVGKIPWRRERRPTLVFWPGEFHGL